MIVVIFIMLKEKAFTVSIEQNKQTKLTKKTVLFDIKNYL